jgi:hypothetical protein
MLAVGAVTFGTLAVVTVPFGTLAVGTVTFGTLTVGAVTFGTLTVGTVTFGTLTVGTVTFGTLTVGTFTLGGGGTLTGPALALSAPANAAGRAIEATTPAAQKADRNLTPPPNDIELPMERSSASRVGKMLTQREGKGREVLHRAQTLF